jgi:protein PhnA
MSSRASCAISHRQARQAAGGGVIKGGTKVSGIRLISDGVGDHDIDAKVPGFGQMQLKSSVVKKVV